MWPQPPGSPRAPDKEGMEAPRTAERDGADLGDQAGEEACAHAATWEGQAWGLFFRNVLLSGHVCQRGAQLEWRHAHVGDGPRLSLGRVTRACWLWE